ncbi:MAG: efflux RND transporter permease subunit [Lachnospiraceae bacterium]|nr:efflux RND transporter permease subunit [Lachnospiraceae bacterium]
MTKFFVKKPYFILVAVIIVLTVGGVSLSKMQTDLLPEFELPYLLVIATEPGASPEKVQKDVTDVLENTLGTVNGVEDISSTSSNNYCMLTLSFADDTNMDSAMVRVSRALDTIELPEEVGKPNVMEISMDMLATMYVGVDVKGMDIKELSEYTKDYIKPYVEKQPGVGSVSVSGLVEDTIEIRLSKDKIDEINDKILSKTNDKLADAKKDIDDAEKKITDGKKEIEDQEKELEKKQNDTNKELADSAVKINQAQATKAAYEASLASLQASKTALEAEKKAYEDAKISDAYAGFEQMFATFNAQLGETAKMMGITIPADLKEAVENKEETENFLKWLQQVGAGEQVKDVTYDSMKQVYDVVNTRLPQIETELANLDTEIKAAEAVLKTVKDKMGDLDSAESKLYEGGYGAAAGFGSGSAQLAAAKTQLDSAKDELKKAKKQLEDSRQAAIDNSNIDALLKLDTLSGLIYAQNFKMPAGYVDDKNDVQWLVEVGDNYDTPEQIRDMVLTKIKDVGTIKVSDVADVTVINNAGDNFSKINGKEAVLLSIYKSSTSGTSEVTKSLTKAFDKLHKEDKNVSITVLMNQGDYITDTVSSVLSSILLGAFLAIFVLALFLKDVKPTIVVAFSIPFSVLFAIIIMYFTGITINVMSLGGLCLSIGMLVDNSIVVIENIYRLRHHGISAARAAVQGTRQVAAPIIASTITTVCVFLPMVYTTGTIADLLMPFAFTISYALIASLIVAMTVVPTVASVILKNTKTKGHRIFDKITDKYAKALEFCLKVKIVPLGIAILLFVLCLVRSLNTGLALLDDMESDQIMGTLVLEEDVDKDTAYKTADEVIELVMSVDGVNKVGVLDGNSGSTSSVLGSNAADNYSNFSFIILTDQDIKSTKEFKRIIKDIEKKTKDVKCENFTVSASAMGSMSDMMGTGVTVQIFGDDTEKLIEISEDLVSKFEKIKGCVDVTNGIDENDKQIHLKMDKDKIAAKGLTVAQIYQEIAAKISTEKTAISMEYSGATVDVNIIDETDKLTYENILDMEVTATKMNESGQQVSKKYKLSKFATIEEGLTVSSITRQNQATYINVECGVDENHNATLLSRKIQKIIDGYKLPEGYTMEISGSTEQVMDMVWQMLEAIALGALLVYLVMVAQFQSLLSPFIIIFTIPLAFTGGMIGLILYGKTISALAMMGFMILMGTVVNNGIVFVDYVNQLRMRGVSRHKALIATGVTRIRPILMTAMTTILSMSVMVFSTDAGNAMQKSMAIVVCFGLIYSTFMTLFIVPVMYDILYKKQPKNIDVGDENLDDIPDEASELLDQEPEMA